jgi:heme A synthase
MKIVLRTLVFHFLCILLFAFIYKQLYNHFAYDTNKTNSTSGEMIDYLLLSVTIQAGIGFSDLYPLSHISKVILMIHQFIVISTHVFTLYIFTI